jgi:uncharacterized membrane protein
MISDEHMNALQLVTALSTLCVLALYEFAVFTLLADNFPTTGTANMTWAPVIIIGYALLGLFGMVAILIGARIVYRSFNGKER